MKDPASNREASLQDAPLYIRWGPDKSPYAIELKLDLVARLRAALSEASATGIEIGGVLVGSLPTPQLPTLRIEELELLTRRSDDSTTFMVESGEPFAEVRRHARARERSAVGLFRSHVRPGALRPSLADRTLLASEFKEPVYALLLAQGAEPFTAAFYVASNGPLPAEMSVREFRLNPDEFRALPEVEPEGAIRPSPASAPKQKSGASTYLALAAIALCIAAALYVLNPSLVARFRPTDDNLGLQAQAQGGSLLRVTWNHQGSKLERSQGATLSVTSAGKTTKLTLGPDELRLGSIVLDLQSPSYQITLALQGPNTGAAAQTLTSHS